MTFWHWLTVTIIAIVLAGILAVELYANDMRRLAALVSLAIVAFTGYMAWIGPA